MKQEFREEKMKKIWKYILAKNKHPMVSVIIPCYGDADASMAVASVPNGCEIIVSDKGNTPAEAREDGLKKAHGEWITFLDADDEFTDSFLYELNNIHKNVVQVIFSVRDEGNDCLRPTDNVFLHGKFYHRSWWKSNNIHFPQVRTNEDVGIYVSVNGILFTNDKARDKTVIIDKEIYLYHNNEKSMTRSNPNYDRDGISDYLEAVCGTLLNRNDIDASWRTMIMERCVAQCRMVDDGSHEKEIAYMENRIKEVMIDYGNHKK